MNIFARAALTAAARMTDRTLTTLCPMRGAARGHTAAHELASTTVLTTTGCATAGGAGHSKK